ncbi:hypothetical protein H5410_037856 [Solanum commersonii]|uniref:Uncharacterized protein n=1 Tax=Solanum commersonii TaxID=4109 RepID=A0A9J5YAP7_SOLCO|nr:hypothetical protein H5410_037856 [Solanum commersonii]
MKEAIMLPPIARKQPGRPSNNDRKKGFNEGKCKKTLLWRYGIDKANDGFVNENDDVPKPKDQSTPPLEENLIHIE